MSNAWDATKTILKYSSPAMWLIAEGAEKAINSVTAAADQGLPQLQEEVAKQNLMMQVSQHQARVEQELAIARRIDNACEVEIEEFYDSLGKGGIGLEATQETISLSAGGESRRITKRIYRFKGWRDDNTEVATQELTDD